MKKFAIVVLLLGSAQAYATRQHCKPEPKPRDPPAVSKPEPAPRTRSDHDRPCDRADAPAFCRVVR